MQCNAMLRMRVVTVGEAQTVLACASVFYQLETDAAACSRPASS